MVASDQISINSKDVLQLGGGNEEKKEFNEAC